MAERRQLTDAELGQALADLGARVAYPPTPQLAQAVRARLVAAPRPRRSLWPVLVPSPRALAAGLLALVLLGGAVLALSPAARTTVAEWLGLRGISIEYVPAAPTPAAAPAGIRSFLGERVTLDEARRRVPFRVRTPSLPELGAPDEVYVGEPPPGGQVSFIYLPRPGLPAAKETGVGMLLTQFRGSVEPGFAKKLAGPDTDVRPVSVDGAPGYWIEGAPHVFIYRDANGNIREETLRLAGNVLLWERDGITYRLESALDHDQAVRIAASLR